MLTAIVLAVIGSALSATSVAVVGGRTRLLTHGPDSDASDRFSRRAGSALLGYGLYTVATGVALTVTDLWALLLTGWTVLTVIVGFGVAVLGAGARG